MAESLRASRTAVQVCQGRAASSVLDDPTAWELLRPSEREPVRWVREGSVPSAWRERVEYETVRATAELMAPRTVAIDRAVVECSAPQVVILGAGLDGRAWRLVSDRTVFEVDQPASQADKKSRAVSLGPGPSYVPVDFRTDRLSSVLAEAGLSSELATVWVWEGVVPYLTSAEVAATAAEVARCSAPGSRLVVNFQTPGRGLALGRFVSRLLSWSAGRASVWRDEPWRSTWTVPEMAALLRRNGFGEIREVDLGAVAEELGVVIRRPASMRHGRVVVADL
ncbi:class I SAM-dependent methyltransferase [Cryptosporangium phraense]|uniref:S-adenosyl-L-methionine-dependent methyltransferase n=1 Tax=Cryptosporangium phraense TaxID=2593070 RepID=A0A545AFT4_9ACTN|nr:class I SAM-dependent methyltransferase [Cryptosporangium phraense]TQS40120.1 class I SAM-dependent methyltransferase [Cryptosporangium phraense]